MSFYELCGVSTLTRSRMVDGIDIRFFSDPAAAGSHPCLIWIFYFIRMISARQVYSRT